MLDSLQKRFAKVKDAKEVVLACVLDPCYKERPLVPEILVKVKTWLKEAMETSPPELHLRRPIPKGREQRTKYPVSWTRCMTLCTSEAVEPEGIIEELERYFREPVIDRKSGNPYDW